MKIKKYILMLAAGILGFTACTDELEEVRLLDPSEVVAPVLHQLPAEVVITKDNSAETINFVWDKAYFGQNVEILYTIFGSSDGGTNKVKLYTVSKETSYSVKYSSLNSALVKDKAAGGLGLEGGVPASVVFTVGATVGSNYQYYYSDNMVVNITPVAAATGNPWADFTEESTWSLIGSIASVKMNWDADLMARTNGTQHVVTKVTLTTADQFKFRKDKAWGTNRGAEGDTEPYVMSVGETISCVNNGKNLAVAADGVYDVMYDEEAESITISEAWVAYPGFDTKSEWSVIGAIASREMEWNKDISMTTDGTWHVAEGVTLTTADQFKFRKDQAWGTNLGATGDTEPFVVTIGEEFTGAGNGKNLAVPADGVYDLLMNPDENLYKVVESLGGFSPLIGEEGGGGDDDDDKYKGWGIIGDFNDWGADAPMTEKNGVWTGYFNNVANGGFKLRKDADWAENYGGTIVTLGTAFEAVAGGGNISTTDAGFYKVVLDLSGDKAMITVSEGKVWSLIGVNGDWDNDIDMEESDGKWVSPATKISGTFKLRYNHAWDINVGGAFEAVGKPFTAVSDGDNITVEEGNYIVTYDPAASTITVDALGWGVVGTINGWGETPDIMMKEDGLFLVAKNITLGADDMIKLRYNQSWDKNVGGRTSVGKPVQAIGDGDNIKPGAGTYDIYYRTDCGVIIVNPAGAELNYWGVVGTINSWGETPDILLYENADGLLESKEIELNATDAIKIRMNEAWTENRGGTFAEFGTAFDAIAGGDNIALGRAAKVQVIYDAAKETITIKGQYSGDAPAYPDKIYAIGGDTGWSDVYTLAGNNGKYKGFGYLSQEFKFKPNADNWDGDWECTGEGKIGQGSNNCPAPATAGYYMIEVDLSEMTYKITLITVISIIGDVKGNWDTDIDLSYNSTNNTWEATGVELNAGVMKFRANHGWDINWGGTLSALKQGGDNIALAEAGKYNVVLYALCDGLAKATVTKQ